MTAAYQDLACCAASAAVTTVSSTPNAGCIIQDKLDQLWEQQAAGCAPQCMTKAAVCYESRSDKHTKSHLF